MQITLSRRWLRLHWLAWLAVLVEFAAILYCQTIGQTEGPYIPIGLSPDSLPVCGITDTWYSQSTLFGWPLGLFEKVENGAQLCTMAAIPATFQYQWNKPELAINCLFLLLLVGSTAYVIESWARRPRRWQFSLLEIVAVTGVVAVLLALMRNQPAVYIPLAWVGLRHSAGFDLTSIAWPITAVILWGVGCLFYTIAWVGTVLLASAGKWICAKPPRILSSPGPERAIELIPPRVAQDAVQR